MNGLARLAHLYGLMERMDAAAARVAANAAESVLRVRMEEHAAGEQQGRLARAAMVDGEQIAWTVAVKALELGEARVLALATVQARYDAARQTAMEKHRASRLRTEQMTRVVEGEHKAQAMHESRRVQAEADDRYASRLLWTRAQERMKTR